MDRDPSPGRPTLVAPAIGPILSVAFVGASIGGTGLVPDG